MFLISLFNEWYDSSTVASSLFDRDRKHISWIMYFCQLIILFLLSSDHFFSIFNWHEFFDIHKSIDVNRFFIFDEIYSLISA